MINFTAPPSKSLAQRALLAASLAPARAGASRIANVPENADVLPLLELLPKFGVTLRRLAPGKYLVSGTADGPWQGGGRQNPVDCDVKESGTLCRLLAALLNSGQGFFRLRGTGRLHERPLGPLGKALQQLGCHIEFLEKDGFPPLLIEGRGQKFATGPNEAGWLGPKPGTPAPAMAALEIAADESSQYISALLMLAPLLIPQSGGLRLVPKGRPVSRPYIDLTLQVLRLAGVQARLEPCPEANSNATPQCFTVLPGAYRSFDYIVEGDWSGAAFLLAAGALGESPVRVDGLQAASAQADKAIIPLLQSMGARVEQEENAVAVYPPPRGQLLRGVEFDLTPCPDLAPVAACLAARASGESLLKNVAQLRIKESDRLAALQRELARAGCFTSLLQGPHGENLLVRPPEALRELVGNGAQAGAEQPRSNQAEQRGAYWAALQHAEFQTDNDHRMAMALSLLGLCRKAGQSFRVRLDNPACVQKSFSRFWQEWEKIL